MVAGSSISGKADKGRMMNGPAPGMANDMAFGPGLALAVRIARRSDPGPLSSVFVTIRELALMIVRTAVLCGPRPAPPVGLLRARPTVLFPPRSRFARIGTATVTLSWPGPKVTVCETG